MYNPNEAMNQRLRAAGNRSRALPNIGQTPAVQAANLTMGQAPAQAAGAVQAAGAAQQVPPQPSPGQVPFAAPQNVNPTTFTMHPPGDPADLNHYNYEPEPDGAWRVYPPGVPAPPHQVQASLPRAASTADYRRMRQAFMQPPIQSPQPAPPSSAPSMTSPMTGIPQQ